jgi:hypothetical protein
VAGRIDIDKQPLSDLVEAMHRHSVSRVIFAADHSQLNRVEEAIGACEVEGVSAWLVTDFIHTSTSKPDFDAFAGRPMLVFRSSPEVSWALLLKGIIDRVSAFVALVIMAIPMGIIALVIRIHKQLLLRRKRALQVGDVFRQAGEQYALTQLASNRPPADIIDDYSLLQEQRERDLLRSNQEVP